MFIRNGIRTLFLICVCATGAVAQDAATQPATSAPASAEPELSLGSADPTAAPLRPFVSLAVPKGTALVVAIDKDVRVMHVGQPVHGRLVEPVYAFDKIVIPVGATVTGRVTGIAGPSKVMRTEAALDANFSPASQHRGRIRSHHPRGQQNDSHADGCDPGLGESDRVRFRR